METLWRAESGVLLRMPEQTAYPARILNNTPINRHVSPLWWHFGPKYEGVYNLKNKDIVMTRQQLDPAGREGKKPTKPRLFWSPMYSVYIRIRRVPTSTTQNDRSIVKITKVESMSSNQKSPHSPPLAIGTLLSSVIPLMSWVELIKYWWGCCTLGNRGNG